MHILTSTCMSFFYSFPSELVRLALRDNAIVLEYPRERLYSTILIFYFASTCLFILASFAFRGYGVQLFVVHADILVFVFFQSFLLSKGLAWAQCFLAVSESVFVLTDTVRRDSIRSRNQRQPQQQSHALPRRNNYQHSALRKETEQLKNSGGDEPHSIDIDMKRLQGAIESGSLFK